MDEDSSRLYTACKGSCEGMEISYSTQGACSARRGGSGLTSTQRTSTGSILHTGVRRTVLSAICVLLVIAQCVTSVPLLELREKDVTAEKKLSEEDIKTYLLRYHYVHLNPHDDSSGSMVIHPGQLVQGDENELFREGLLTFQRTWGLQETGVPDDATRYLMSLPRCGVPDDQAIGSIDGNDVSLRVRRYTHYGERWPSNTITFYAKHHPSATITEAKFHAEIQRALQIWASVAPLNFVEKSSKRGVDIAISFERYYHGDSSPFDGRSGVLAHAYAPPDGQLHFDVDEEFRVNSTGERGTTDFFFVAAHELGHALGIGHSWAYGSLMAPFYRGAGADANLQDDDIKAIQSRYGTGRGSVKTLKKRNTGTKDDITRQYMERMQDARRRERQQMTTTTTTTTEAPTTTTTSRYVRYGWWNQRKQATTTTPQPDVMDRDSEENRIPSRRSETEKYDRDSNRVPTGQWNYCRESRVDAVVQHMVKGKLKVFAFRRHEVVLLDKTGSRVEKSYPRRIDQVFPGLPGNIDAAFYYGPDPDSRRRFSHRSRSNARTYFFKANMFWEYRDGTLQPGFPKKIRDVWRGVPNDIDAAFMWSGNSKIYFIKGSEYYRFNLQIGRVDGGYPRPLSGVWDSLPGSIDAALKLSTIDGRTGQLNTKTFFFEGNYYYRYTEDSLHADAGYPKTIRHGWFGCPGMLQSDRW